MPQVAEKEEKITLEHLCRQVAVTEDERVVFEFQGKKYALLSIEEFEYFQDLEDKDDAAAAQAALDEMEAKGLKPIPLEEVLKEYGYKE